MIIHWIAASSSTYELYNKHNITWPLGRAAMLLCIAYTDGNDFLITFGYRDFIGARDNKEVVLRQIISLVC